MGLAYNAEAFANFRTATFVEGDDIDEVYDGDVRRGTRACSGTNTHYVPGEHRIDNYARNSRFRFAKPSSVIAPHPNEGKCNFNQQAEDRAVILHNETAGTGTAVSPSPKGDYVYEFVGNCVVPVPNVESRSDEARISFNNTWGPTLWDGDDYNLGNNFTVIRDASGNETDRRNAYNGVGALREMRQFKNSGATPSGDWNWLDDWDQRMWDQNATRSSIYNSLAEVEEAIRHDGQKFVSYYFDGDLFDKSSVGGQAALTSYYFAHFPTKFYYGESSDCYSRTNLESYIERAVSNLISLAKPLAVEVWDTNENSGGQSTDGCISPDPCGRSGDLALQFELNFFDIKFLKTPFVVGNTADYRSGRVVVSPIPGANDPIPPNISSFPGLFYTFEIDDNFSSIGHWRSMQRGK
jgi:hypothetical protein